MKYKENLNDPELQVERSTILQKNFARPSGQVLLESFYSTLHNREVCKFGIHLTEHSLQRSKHRGISPDDISLAITYGDEMHKQGMTFYHMKRKNIPSYIEKETALKIQDIVVVMDRSASTVITCYKSKNASQHLKRKQKYLLTYEQQ